MNDSPRRAHRGQKTSDACYLRGYTKQQQQQQQCRHRTYVGIEIRRCLQRLYFAITVWAP